MEIERLLDYDRYRVIHTPSGKSVEVHGDDIREQMHGRPVIGFRAVVYSLALPKFRDLLPPQEGGA
jgi:hypothetical protein